MRLSPVPRRPWVRGHRRVAGRVGLGFVVLALPCPQATAEVSLLSPAHPALVSDSAQGSFDFQPSVSDDGRFVAFAGVSAELLEGFVDRAPFGGPESSHVFLADRATGEVALVSRAAGQATHTGNGASFAPALSGDGRHVVFVSRASDLVPGQVDVPGTLDAFLYDRATGVVTLVSHAAGAPLVAVGCDDDEDDPSRPSVSADGSVVAFVSNATHVTAGQVDVQGTRDVFLHDVATGVNVLASHAAAGAGTAGNGFSLLAGGPEQRRLSADGRRVAFVSFATDLVAGGSDANGDADAFVYDRVTGEVTLLSHAAGLPLNAADAGASEATLSRDGQWVAWTSTATDVIAGQVDVPWTRDVFQRPVSGGPALLVSHKVGLPATAADAASFGPRLDAGGSAVAFISQAGDLTAGLVSSDPNGFLFDRASGANTLVTRGRPGVGLGVSALSEVSDDGQRVAFATTGAPGGPDQAAGTGVYLFDRGRDVLRLVSHAAGNAEAWANGPSTHPRLSADGQAVTFWSHATDLVASATDRNQSADLFVGDAAGTALLTRRAVEPPSSTPAHGAFLYGPSQVSDDGRFVLFSSRSTGLLPGLGAQAPAVNVFLLDRADGSVRLVSRRASDPLATGTAGGAAPVLSSDGRWAAFASTQADLVVSQDDTNQVEDTFLYEVASGSLRLVSHAHGNRLRAASGQSFPMSISADGRFLVIATTAHDVQARVQDTNGIFDLYVYDRLTGGSTLVSHRHDNPTATAADFTEGGVISADGRFVVFASFATDLVAGRDTNGERDVFVYDRASGSNALVSHRPGLPGQTGDGESWEPDISGDGRYVAFTSKASNLVAGQVDPAGREDVFLWDRGTGTTALVSHVAGQPAVAATGGGMAPRLSRDGSALAFISPANDLVPGVTDLNNAADVWVYRPADGTSTLVSHAAGLPNVTADDWSYEAAIDATGSRVVFRSLATDLAAGQVDDENTIDVFLHTRAAGTTVLAAPRHGSATEAVGGGLRPPQISADGSFVVYTHHSAALVEHDRNSAADVFGFAPGPAAGR